MRFLAVFVLKTFENHTLAGLAGGERQLQRGCVVTSPMSRGCWQILFLKPVENMVSPGVGARGLHRKGMRDHGSS